MNKITSLKKCNIILIVIILSVVTVLSVTACHSSVPDNTISNPSVDSPVSSITGKVLPPDYGTNTPATASSAGTPASSINNTALPSPDHATNTPATVKTRIPRTYFEQSDRKMKVSDFNALKVGMTIDEVEAIVGKAHHPIGSGVGILCYNLEDENTMVLMYESPNLLRGMYILHPDGSKTGLLPSVSPVPSSDFEYKFFYDQQEIIFPEDNGILVYQGKVYVPLEYYSECLGKVVYVSEETNRVNICSTKGEGYVPIATDPDRKPLNRNEFNFITKGMSGSEVRDKIRLPQDIYNDHSGLGFFTDQYSLDDGSALRIFYGLDRTEGVQSVIIFFIDGQRDILVK